MNLLDCHHLSADSTVEGSSLASYYMRGRGEVGDSEFIRNVETEMWLLDTGTHQFPVSVNFGHESVDNSYVASPMTTYIGYAHEEIKRLNRPWLTWPLMGLVSGMAGLLERAQINRIVQVNNWLISTNLYPSDWQGEDIPEITQLLVETYPDHAIAFRSLNHRCNHALIERLQSLGYVAVPSRQVYVFDATKGAQSKMLSHHNTMVDSSLLRRSSYQIVQGNELLDSDFHRLEELYNQLYLDKYCRLNPQFTADWLKCGQRDGWLDIRVLRTKDGRIDGVLGWFANDQILTAPIVGYDTTLPQRQGLYRMLTNMCLQEAVAQRCVLNFSSGAAQFKRLRGGQPEIEYSMVYARHLSASRQRVWKLLSHILRMIGVPMMRMLKL